MIAIVIALTLLVIAALNYPGGSQYDKNSVGYDWKNNYISNLFGEKAMNGLHSGSRFWAAAGMLFLCGGCTLFFIEFSKKIPEKGPAKIIRYFGAGGMLCAFLAVTPYHDIMVTIASTMALVSMFYVTVFILKARLYLFSILSVVCLLVFYVAEYVYYTRTHLEYLPVLQKATLAITVAWILCLHYFTAAADFEPGAKVEKVPYESP